MRINALPQYDLGTNLTGCCPKFEPSHWEGVELHFRNKSFIRAETRSFLHFPLNMGRVFSRVLEAMRRAEAYTPENYIVLSRELSAWRAEHLFAAKSAVPGEQTIELSGDFRCVVFEGPYSEARHWHRDLTLVSVKHGKPEGRAFLFYTTCPKCSKVYGKNYVVGLAEI